MIDFRELFLSSIFLRVNIFKQVCACSLFLENKETKRPKGGVHHEEI